MSKPKYTEAQIRRHIASQMAYAVCTGPLGDVGPDHDLYDAKYRISVAAYDLDEGLLDLSPLFDDELTQKLTAVVDEYLAKS